MVSSQVVSVRFWKLSILNCLSALAHWPSVSHFVLTRSQQGSTRCDLRAEAAREWRDVPRVTEPGPALPSVFGFRQADPLGQPHMHPRLYIPHGSADSILKWTVWSSLGGPLTSLGPHLRKELFPESFPHHQPLLSLSPHPAPPPHLGLFYVSTDWGGYCPSYPLEQRREIWLLISVPGAHNHTLWDFYFPSYP